MSITSLPTTERALITISLVLATQIASAREDQFKSICDNWLRFNEDARGGEALDWKREDWIESYQCLFFDLASREVRESDPRFRTLNPGERLVAAQAVELAMNIIRIPDPVWVCKAWLTEGRPDTYSALWTKRNAKDFEGLLSKFAERIAA